jgi:hypothetical protein
MQSSLSYATLCSGTLSANSFAHADTSHFNFLMSLRSLFLLKMRPFVKEQTIAKEAHLSWIPIMHMREIRTPKMGDRVAIPNHAGIFIVKSVNQLTETADADLTTKIGWVEKDVPWIKLTFIDEERQE